jgi:hypothetical protein
VVRDDTAVKAPFYEVAHCKWIFFKVQITSQKKLNLSQPRSDIMIANSFKYILINLSESYPEVIIKLSNKTKDIFKGNSSHW